MRTKKAGRLVALGLMTVVVGGVLVALLSGPRSASSGASPSAPVSMGTPPETTRAVLDPQRGGAVQDLVSLASEGTWTRVDPATGEVAMRLTWERLDPLEAGRFEISRPRAWMYEDERVVEVSSAVARVVWPSREREPESGTLGGGVTITIRSENAGEGDGAREIVRASSETMGFETALGEIRTADVVRVLGSGFDGALNGLELRLRSGPASPLRSMLVPGGGKLVARGGRASSTGDDGAPETQDGRAGTAAGAGLEEFFAATVEGALRVESGTRVVEGHRLRVWARLVDGRLPEGAIAEFPGAQEEPSARATGLVAGTEEMVPLGGEDGLAFAAVWSGALRVEPIERMPEALKADQLFASLEGEPGASVESAVVRDTASGGSVRALTIAYGASRRVVALKGEGDWNGGASGLTLSLPELGEALGESLTFDLTSGRGAFEGPGEINAEGDERGIAWLGGAEFDLDVSNGPLGGREEVELEDVRLREGVEAFDGGACLKGEFVRASWGGGTPANGGEVRGTLERVSVRGAGYAADETGAAMIADELDVRFAVSGEGDEPVPTLVQARGSVVASRPGQSLAAETLEARLDEDEGGSVRVAAVEAREDVRVRFENERGGGVVIARAGHLVGDVSSGVFDLTGSEELPVVLGRSGADGEGELSAGSARIESASSARRLTMFGPGSASYRTVDARTGASDSARVVWAGSMTYDDSTGRSEIIGSTSATFDRGGGERHSAKGERLVVDITPAPSDGPPPARRDLLRALVEGGETPAEVELRRLGARASGTAEAGEEALEALAFLRGPSIELDAVGLTVGVEGAGLLLLEDRRPSDAPENNGAAAGGSDIVAVGRASRGTTLVEWDGGMVLDRSTGLGEVRDNVRVRHRDRATGKVAELTCARVGLTTREAPGAGEGIELVRAEAAGAVRARYQSQIVEGERLVYDAAAGTIVVTGDGSRPATGYDESTGRSASAQTVILDLASGNWRVEGAETIVAPR